MRDRNLDAANSLGGMVVLLSALHKALLSL